MIWSIAWRNVWRNKLRSLVMIAAIALGLFAGVFILAFMQGMVNTRIDTATKSELSHLQIHEPRFLENNEAGYYISNASEIMREIGLNDTVEAVSRRLIAEPFIQAAHGTGGGKLIGIDPGQEKKVTDIFEHLTEGTYLEKTGRMPPVLIGQKLADKLKLKVGSKINVQMVDLSGDLSSKAYRVSGIYKSSNTGYDELHLFVSFQDLQTQLGLDENTAHEIAVLLKKGDLAPVIKPTIEKIAGNHVVQTWKELSPEISLLTDSMDQYMYIFILIILLGLCFGIINTMLMAVLERVKEIGMLMAVGMNKRKVFTMIILESVMLTLSGGVAGIIIGVAVTKIFEKNPINLSIVGQGMEQYGYATNVYTYLPAESLGTIIVLVLLTGMISAVYPARKALKLNPAEATRSE